ncbi:MAG: hypothetical protein JEZ00_16750 [Anaerolineaceae bacterium]|nr:hypothetical protein [Anaerolineaceae bacterium]
MSKNKKILLFILVGLILLCICGCIGTFVAVTYGGEYFMENAVVDDPQAAQALGDAMFDYTVPPGYKEDAAVDMGIMKMVMIMPGGNTSQMIMLMELPAFLTANSDTYRDQMLQQMQNQLGTQGSMELVDQETMTIRGQEVELLYMEGNNSEYGYTMRTMTSSFIKGNSGQVMVMIMGPSASWDQNMVDGFLQSIH